MTDERRRILDFLEQQLFGPALGDSLDLHPAFRRAEAEAVRAALGRERERLSGTPSADALLANFREAAARSAGNGLDERLGGFGLPTFGAVGAELEKLAAELGVAGRPEPAAFPR